MHDTFAPQDSTITWRPKYCKDVFLFLSADTDAVVVGMAQTDTTEFFSAQDATAPHPFVDEACTVFAHLTCDVHEDRSAQMVLLCYDVLEHQMLQNPLPPSQRYQRLLTVGDNFGLLLVICRHNLTLPGGRLLLGHRVLPGIRLLLPRLRLVLGDHGTFSRTTLTLQKLGNIFCIQIQFHQTHPLGKTHGLHLLKHK